MGLFITAGQITSTKKVSITQTSTVTIVDYSTTVSTYSVTETTSTLTLYQFRVASIAVMPDALITMWQFCGSYCKATSNASSPSSTIPANITISLQLYEFYIQESADDESGSYYITNIPVNMTSGLPDKPVIEQFPDMMIVDNVPLPTSVGNNAATCAMFALLWHMTYPPGDNPYGGNSYEDAINGKYLGQVDKVPTWLSCPPSSVGIAAYE